MAALGWLSLAGFTDAPPGPFDYPLIAVTYGGAPATTSFTTPVPATTDGETLVAVVGTSAGSTGAATVTDDAGNTWTKLQEVGGSGLTSTHLAVFAVSNALSITSVTVGINTARDVNVALFEIDATGVDASVIQTDVAATTHTPPALTPGAAGEVVISAIVTGGSRTATQAVLTDLPNAQQGSTVLDVAYSPSAGAGAVQPTWTLSGSGAATVATVALTVGAPITPADLGTGSSGAGAVGAGALTASSRLTGSSASAGSSSAALRAQPQLAGASGAAAGGTALVRAASQLVGASDAASDSAGLVAVPAAAELAGGGAAAGDSTGVLTMDALIGGPGGLSTEVTDTLTDLNGTPLENHVMDSGDTWTEHPTATGGAAVITTEGKYRCTQGVAVHVASWVPPSAEYDVVMDHNFKSLIATNSGVGQFGRLDPTIMAGYHVRYTGASSLGGGRWELYKFASGGVITALGTFAQTLTAGQTYNVRLVIRNAYKAVEINGVERIRSTDNAITAAGRVGIRGSTAVAPTTGVHLDNLSAEVPVTGGATSSAKAGNTGRLVFPAPQLVGTSPIAALTSGQLSVSVLPADLAGSSAAAGLSAGNVQVPVTLVGSTTGLAASSGQVMSVPQVAGSSAGAGTSTGSLRSIPQVAGSSGAAAVFAGQLMAASRLNGSSVSAGSSSGQITATSLLSGSAAAAAAGVAGVTASTRLVGAGPAVAVSSGNLTVPGLAVLTGSSSATAGASGALSASLRLQGSSGSSAASNALLAAAGRLSGASGASASSTAGLTAAGRLSGASSSTAGMSGFLRVIPVVSGMSSAAAAGQGDVSAAPQLSAASFAAAGSAGGVNAPVNVTGASAAVTFSFGTLALPVSLDAESVAQAGGSANLIVLPREFPVVPGGVIVGAQAGVISDVFSGRIEGPSEGRIS